jgi:hypothetical protein
MPRQLPGGYWSCWPLADLVWPPHPAPRARRPGAGRAVWLHHEQGTPEVAEAGPSQSSPALVELVAVGRHKFSWRVK